MPIRRMTDAEFVVELKLQRKEARVEIEQLRSEVERLRTAIDYAAKCAHERIATKAELAKLLEDALAREDGAS